MTKLYDQIFLNLINQSSNVDSTATVITDKILF
jgi:hypothetical protein